MPFNVKEKIFARYDTSYINLPQNIIIARIVKIGFEIPSKCIFERCCYRTYSHLSCAIVMSQGKLTSILNMNRVHYYSSHIHLV